MRNSNTSDTGACSASLASPQQSLLGMILSLRIRIDTLVCLKSLFLYDTNFLLVQDLRPYVLPNSM